MPSFSLSLSICELTVSFVSVMMKYSYSDSYLAYIYVNELQLDADRLE